LPTALPEGAASALGSECEATCLTLIDQLRKRNGYLRLEEAADLLGIHTMTLRKWVKARKIQGVRIGDEIKIDPNVLADWLSARFI
jgi:excisionase family DNA binding protein